MDRAEAIKRLEWLATVGGVVNSCTIGGEDMDALNMAIAALREQEQREQGCEYCSKGFAVLNNTMEYSGLEFALMNKAIRVRYFPSHEYTTFSTQDILPIKCCPICGRKLGGAEG